MLLAFQRATLKAGSGLACEARNALNSCLRPCGGQVQSTCLRWSLEESGWRVSFVSPAVLAKTNSFSASSVPSSSRRGM